TLRVPWAKQACTTRAVSSGTGGMGRVLSDTKPPLASGGGCCGAYSVPDSAFTPFFFFPSPPVSNPRKSPISAPRVASAQRVTIRLFVLIDLWSQANYLPREVRSWPWERFVCWLELFGQVDRVEAPTVDDAFYFISAAGSSATLHFSES